MGDQQDQLNIKNSQPVLVNHLLRRSPFRHLDGSGPYIFTNAKTRVGQRNLQLEKKGTIGLIVPTLQPGKYSQAYPGAAPSVEKWNKPGGVGGRAEGIERRDESSSSG